MKKLILTLVTTLGLASLAKAEGGTTVGSGGDALRELFNQAKSAAALKVEQVNICSFDSSTPQSVRDWLTKNQTSLAMDIRMSQHAWVVDSQSTCGFTDHSPHSTVYLSYPTCATTAKSLNDALFVLVHESAHHLGVDDERQADEIARAVLYSAYVANCSAGSGVFDPNICSSAPMTTDDARRYFKPGDVSSKIGTYKFYGQVSRCVALSGCEPIKPWEFAARSNGQSDPTMYVELVASDTDPYFIPYFHLGPFSSGMTSGDFLTSSLASVDFRGLTYREEGYIQFSTNQRLADLRFRRGCLWAKWVYTERLSSGSTEKYEIVLYGTH